MKTNDMYLKKELYELIRTDESIFDFIQEGSLDGLWYWDLENPENEWMNARFWTVLGYNPEEMPHKSNAWQNIINQDDLKLATENFTKHCENPNHPYDQIVRYTHKNGSMVWVHCRGMAIRDKNGKPIRMLGTHQDITKIKNAERELISAKVKTEESEERFNLTMKAANDGIFDWNLETNEIFYSPGWKKILGYEDHELPNDFSVWEKTTDPEDVKKSWELQQKLITKQIDRFVFEFKMKHKDGHWVDILSQAEAILNESGKVVRMVGTHTDITDRKLAEEEIHNTHNRLAYALKLITTIISAVPIPLFYKDREGRYIGVNDAFSELLGFTPDYYPGKTVMELWPNEFAEVYHRKDMELMRHPEKQVYDFKVLDKHGVVHQAIWSKNVFRDENGEVAGIVGAFQDITERKQTEEALRESEEKFSTAFQTSPNAITITRANDGKFIELNNAFTTMTGFTREEALADSSIGLKLWFNIEDRDRVVNELSAGRTVLDHEYQFRRKGNKTFIGSFSARIIRLGGEHCILSSILDITERKQNELLLATERQRLASIIEGTNVGTWEWNFKTGEIVYNDKWAAIIGYTLEEITPVSIDTWKKFTHPDDIKKSDELLKKHFTKELDYYHCESRMKHKNGNWVWILDRGKVYEWDDDGKPLKMSGTHQDITEERKAKLELIKAKEKAEESDRLKSAFLANMSHEIRTPMNGILGFASLLKEPGLAGDEQQRYIGIIEKSGVRMLNIINDIVDISKIEADLMELNVKASNINEQIEYIYTFFKPEAEAKRLKLSYNNTLPAKEATIETDREKVFAILTNLIKNAIKYTHNGSIELGYDMVQTHNRAFLLQFYVKDTGIGIPKDRQEAIFERFVQADIADKKAYQGAGLGLSISKAYVEMLGGKIWVESEEGIGSTFFFTLPYNPEPEKESIDLQAASLGNKDDIRKLKTLIVEDDEVSEMLLDETIKTFSKEILKARTGIEAVEVCHDNPDINLILMDIRMSGMGGYEATKQIREINKEVIIIAQTAHGMLGDWEKSIASGCNDYIAKPIIKEELLALIQKYFRK